MASQPPSISRQEASALVRQVQSPQLINRQLSSICQVNGLKSTGVKAELQRRIINLIQSAVNINDASRFHQIRQSIHNALALRASPMKGGSNRNPYSTLPPSQVPLPGSSPNSMSSHNHNSAGNSRDYRMSSTNGQRSGYQYNGTIQLNFKPSPFYQIQSPICDVRICEVMQHHRHSVNIFFKLSECPALQKCIEDKSYRVLVFCAGEVSGVQNIAFPHQCELRVNSDEIKANLRGLKNKPGSTRPVDITHALRLRPDYQNNIELIYALTNKKFYVVAYLCKVTTVPELVSTVSTRRRIPRASVVAELNKIAQDPDVVATSQVLSLKCPLSYMRLTVPCRSLSCTHIQCFDATSYLQLQEQGPQWLCPICNKSAPFEQLAVDEYVRDILDNTPSSLEAVTIEPNGRWSAKSSGDEKSTNPTNGTSFKNEDDDDDDLEISEISIIGGRSFETPKNSTPNTTTSVSASRGTSNGAPRGLGSTSAKRPAPEVIDLTLSSDEEDEEPIQRHNKRQNTGTNGFRGQDGRNFLSESPMETYP